MGVTSIEWTDRSVNPIRARDQQTNAVGHYCEKLSPGCANCYASRFQCRKHMPAFPGANKKLPTLPVLDDIGMVPVGGGDLRVFFDPARLHEVLRRKTPTKWFWCDMSDLFGSWVPDEWIDCCFATMAASPQHTHQILTKRPDRMLKYLTSGKPNRLEELYAVWSGVSGSPPEAMGWPLPNVWLGTSVEDQKAADARIPSLLSCPAAVRFLSVEPLLGAVDLTADGLWETECPACKDGCYHDPGTNEPLCERGDCGGKSGEPGIQWVIVGGESGNKARPCHIEWIESIVAQCKAAAVPCFVKQLGKHPTFFNDGSGAGGTIHEFRVGPPDYPHEIKDPKGGDWEEWPEDLRVREFPATPAAVR